MQNYTLSLWYRVKLPIIQPQMTLISLQPNGFECQLAQNLQIRCLSSEAPRESLQVNSKTPHKQWQILTIKADNVIKSRSSELKIIDLTGAIVAQQMIAGKFFPTLNSQTTNTTFNNLTLGISSNRKSDGFIGNLRNLRIFEGIFSDQFIYKMQFIYIFPLQYVKVQLLSDMNELINQGGSMNRALSFGQLSTDKDSMGIFQCTNRLMYNTSFMQREAMVMQGQTRFSVIQVSNDIYDWSYLTGNRESNLQAWLYHDIKYNQTLANDEIILRQDSILNAYFSRSMPNILIVENPFQISGSQVRTYFPPNQWIYLSITNQRDRITVSLRNRVGSLLSLTQTNFAQVIPQRIKREITILDYFNGKILGLKYYKGSIPMISDFHYFWELPIPSSTESAVIALYFNSTRLQDGSKTSFKNFGRNQFPVSLLDPTRMSIQFGQSYFITNRTSPEQIPFYPVFRQNESYDGYTCVDEKEKLFFSSQVSNAQTNLIAPDNLNQYTVELWFKAQYGLVGENYMVSIVNNPAVTQNKNQVAILQESDGILACQASFSAQSSSDVKLRYFDYQKESRAWTHVACAYDGQKLLASGFMLQQNIEYQFFTEFSRAQNLTIPKGRIQIYINANARTMQRGCPSTFYSELRFWKSVRTMKQIQSMRYQQLEISDLPSQLIAYAKLMAGSNRIEQEYVSGGFINASKIEWQADYELLVCPVGTYRPSQFDMNCYRDAIQEVSLIHFKTEIGINVMSYFTNFQNINMRDLAASQFNYQWTVDAIQGPSSINLNSFRATINNQSTIQNIQLDYEDLADSTLVKYVLRLTLSDKLQLSDPKSGVINIIPMRCGNIFDRDTRESFVLRDLDIQKGIDDYTFFYNFTDCIDYKLDQNLIVFSVDGVGDLSSAEHNKERRSFTLKSLYHSSLPLNDYFYLKVRGYWKNTKNQYDQVSFNLIYGFRFIQKIVINLQPSSTLLMKGQTLQIQAQTKLVNINQFPKDRTFLGRWICPGRLQQYCAIVQSQTLRIPFEIMIDYNLSFWDPINYTYVASTNYLQMDGSRESNKSVSITWLDALQNINVKAINQANIQQPFSWQVEESYSKPELFRLQWDITPAVPSGCLLNFANRTQYTINQTCLKVAMTYEITIKLQYLVTSTVVSTQKILFTVPRKPFGGRLQCIPTAGKAFFTKFNCTASGWTAVDNVIQYQFFTKDKASGSEMIAGPVQQSSQLINTVFPPTNQILVIVIDRYNQISEALFSVNITYQPDGSSTLDDLLNEYLSNKTIINPQHPNHTLPPTPPPNPNPVLPSPNPPPTPTKPPSPPVSPTPPPSTPAPTPQPVGPQPSPTPSPVPPSKPPTPPKDPMAFMTDLVKQIPSLSLDGKNKTTQQVQNTALQISNEILNQSKSIKTISDIQNRTFFITGSFQAMQVITSESKALTASSLQMIQQSTTILLQQSDVMTRIETNNKFQADFFRMQSNTLTSVKAMNTSETNEIVQGVRKNLLLYETHLSKSENLVQGVPVQYNTDQINFKVNQYSRTSNQSVMNDEIINTTGVSAVLPLSTALQPTQKQTVTVINYKQSPFLNSETQMYNQTLLTNNTLFFALRDKNGSYLNSSYLMERIRMNFTIENLQSFNQSQKESISCAYQSPDDKYFKTQECETELNINKSQVMCSCKHMSYYTIIENKFDEEAYNKLQNELYTIKIKNWIFFIPAAYVLLLFILGFIYTQNKDQVDFRFIADQEDLQISQVGHKKENSITLTGLLFHRKIVFQNNSQKVTFCGVFKYLILMTHPLFQLKYRFDPTLPRFYKFLMIYTRIMVIFGLCFYFLRDFVNFDEIFKKDPNKQLNDLLYLGVSLAICSFSMAPLPQFLYGCCRSSYFLGQQDKLTEPGSRDEMPSSQGAHNSPEDNLITKVKIDPSIPMKLLFLLNASSHEKLIAEKDSKEAFASGGLRAVGRKLWSLQKEQGLQFANISNLGPGIPEQMDNYNGKQYIVDNLTEMDMIKNMENSQRNVIASESKIDKRESSPPHHAGRSPSLSGSINDQNNKRLITFQKGDYNTGNFSTQQRKPQHGGQPRHMSHNDIQLKFDHNRQNSIFNQQQQYRSLRSGGGTNSQILDRVQSLHQQRSHRSSNRISQTEENEEDITPRQQYEGGESTDRRKTNSPQNDLQNGPRNSSNIGGGSVLSANIINFDDDLIRGESDITIDSKLVAAEDKKELFERKGFALLGRILWILLSIGINGFVVFVVGYLYYTEQFYNKDNNYVWVVIFFGAQFLGFFIIDMIAILLIAMCVKCLCQNSKTFLAVLMRESLYVYEDYKYLAEFTFKESNEAAIEN